MYLFIWLYPLSHSLLYNKPVNTRVFPSALRCTSKGLNLRGGRGNLPFVAGSSEAQVTSCTGM